MSPRAGEFDQRDEECAGVRKRNMRLNQSLLHLAEMRWHEQFHPAGNAEEETGEDTCYRHRLPIGGAEPGKYALNRVLHPLRPPRISGLWMLDAGMSRRLNNFVCSHIGPESAFNTAL